MARIGRGVFRRRGVVSALVLLPVCTGAVFSPPWVGEGAWYDVLGDFVAWMVLGAGIFLRLWATLYIGGRKSVELVTTGPYALCRHPLYVASFLILVSLGIFLLSASALAAACPLAIVYDFVVVPSEERHALDCFGDEYREYMAATPRFLPHTQGIAPPGVIEITVGAFLREYARTFGLIALGAAIDLLAYCRTQPWWRRHFTCRDRFDELKRQSARSRQTLSSTSAGRAHQFTPWVDRPPLVSKFLQHERTAMCVSQCGKLASINLLCQLYGS